MRACVQTNRHLDDFLLLSQIHPTYSFIVGGDGVEVLYDHKKIMFIISDRVEDRLLVSLRINEIATNTVYSSTILLNDAEYSVADRLKQKLWRRFLRHYIGSHYQIDISYYNCIYTYFFNLKYHQNNNLCSSSAQ